MSQSQPAVGADAIAVPAMAVLVALFGTLILERPAFGQGGLVCDVGPAEFRRCCKESFRRNPDLDVTARAADIEACLKPGAHHEPAVEPPDAARGHATERNSGAAAPPGAPPASSAPQAPSAPPVVLRNTGAGTIRRVVCASEPCAKGCDADEMAISAFCKIGSFPALTPSGAVRCAAPGAATELPIVLFCAKR